LYPFITLQAWARRCIHKGEVMKVWLTWQDETYEPRQLIGVFSSEKSAKAAVKVQMQNIFPHHKFRSSEQRSPSGTCYIWYGDTQIDFLIIPTEIRD
jgi:hypothetical protein